jgi:hypothetical protein
MEVTWEKDLEQVISMLEFLIDSIFVSFGGILFQQVIGIPMGTNCAPLLADLFLYSYESEFLQKLVCRWPAETVSLQRRQICYRWGTPAYWSLVPRSSMFYLFEFCLKNMWNCSLTQHKWDDFNFKIINFPNMCSNIPASPAYGVYISQLIHYARASSNYSDFLKRHLHLRNRQLDQGYKKIRLIRSYLWSL